MFTRDIGFVIDDQFILPNVIEDQLSEAKAIDGLLNGITSSNIIMMPSGCYAEGGDVIVHEPFVFVGVSNDETFDTFITARTNTAGVDYLQDEFPAYDFKGFELLKSDVDPRKGSLHLDCAFQPLGDALLLALIFSRMRRMSLGLNPISALIIFSTAPKMKPTTSIRTYSYWSEGSVD